MPTVGGEVLPGGGIGPVGGGEGGTVGLGDASAMTLDLYASIIANHGELSGLMQYWRPNAEPYWDTVSAAITADAAKRGTLVDLTEGGDVTDAVRAALDAASVNGRGLIVFTRGTGTISELIEHDSAYSRIMLVGQGRGVSTLKQADGANLDVMYRFGEASGATKTSRVGAFGLTFDGNEQNNSASSPDALVRAYNVELSAFDFLEIIESEGLGIRVNADSINSAHGNQWSRLLLRLNNAGGGRFSDLKYNEFNMLIADNQVGGYGMKFDDGTTEFTQNVITNVIVHDNPEEGVILAGTARTSLTGLDANANGEVGLLVAASTQPNSPVITGATFRRNADASTVVGIDIEAGSGVRLRNVEVFGGASGVTDQIGIRATCDRFTMSGIHIQTVKGRAILLDSCNNGSLSEVTCIANGEATAAPSHDIHLVNCTDVSISEPVCEDNTVTTGGNYCLAIEGASTRRIRVRDVTLDAATSGNEMSVAAGLEQYVDIQGGGFLRGSTTYTPTVVLPNSTGLTVTIPADALLYGILKLDGSAGTAGSIEIASFTVIPEGITLHVITSSGGNIVFKHGTGNISLSSGADVTGSGTKQYILSSVDGAFRMGVLS